MSGGRATPALRKTGPMAPVTALRTAMRMSSFSTATHRSRSRPCTGLSHSGRKPALAQRSWSAPGTGGSKTWAPSPAHAHRTTPPSPARARRSRHSPSPPGSAPADLPICQRPLGGPFVEIGDPPPHRAHADPHRLREPPGAHLAVDPASRQAEALLDLLAAQQLPRPSLTHRCPPPPESAFDPAPDFNLLRVRARREGSSPRRPSF